MDWIKKLKIKYLRGIYSRDGLPGVIKKECGIINLDDKQGPDTFSPTSHIYQSSAL